VTPDVLIVGGGIISGAVAYELACAGAKVLILERSQAGREASWAAGGMLAPTSETFHDLPLLPFALESMLLYPDFLARVQNDSRIEVDYRTEGTLLIALNAAEAARLEQAARMLASQKLAGQMLSGEEARQLEPALAREVCSALLLPKDHQVDNRRLTEAVFVAAQKRGARLRERTTVETIVVEHGRAVAVKTAGERVAAAKILVAAGCWSATLGPECARLAPTKPIRGQMLALKMAKPCLSRVIRGAVYLVPGKDGRVVVGSTVEDVGFDKSTTPEVLSRLRASAEEIVPGLREAEIAESWAGLRPDSPDHLPILGACDIENLFLATGHYRNGILLAPATARAMVELILRGSSSLPIETFSPLRFR